MDYYSYQITYLIHWLRWVWYCKVPRRRHILKHATLV